MGRLRSKMLLLIEGRGDRWPSPLIWRAYGRSGVVCRGGDGVTTTTVVVHSLINSAFPLFGGVHMIVAVHNGTRLATVEPLKNRRVLGAAHRRRGGGALCSATSRIFPCI